jgi:SAM-dependent methyltransferase
MNTVPLAKTLMRKPISILKDTAKAIAPEWSLQLYKFVTSAKNVCQGKRYYCPVCNTRRWHFNFFPIWLLMKWDEYGYVHSIFAHETLNIFALNCPRCGATDRDRLYALYLKQEFDRMDVTKKYLFIDFGPSEPLSRSLRKYPFLNYRSADLFLDNVDDRVDIADMPIYKDNSIDIFLCSHVLEHVEDDRKAIAELYRILNQDGWGIVMAPILLTLSDVYEDASIKSDADKWKHFGQPDHFRLYSKQGFIARLEEAGFEVNQFGIDYFGADAFERHGIHPRSVLYVVRKP